MIHSKFCIQSPLTIAIWLFSYATAVRIIALLQPVTAATMFKIRLLKSNQFAFQSGMLHYTIKFRLRS